MSTQDLFAMSTTIDPEKDYTADLVGQDKKFQDVKALARAKVESDLFIDHLKKELAEAREDALRRKTVEEAISALQNTNNSSSSQDGLNRPDGNSAAEAVALNEEQMKQLIRESVVSTIESQRNESVASRNIEMVKSTLEAAWGQDFPLKLKQAATELGVSEAFISEMAKTQPKALFKLVGVTEGTQRAPEQSLFAPSGVGVNTAALANNRRSIPEQESYSYWQKMRKENPNLYHSPKSAMARFDAAKKHGDAFYAN